jgi:hypothetical protein
MSLCNDLQKFLQDHGPQPEVRRLLPEGTEDFTKRWRETVPPWNNRFHGDYRAKFLQSVPAIRDEIKAATGVSNFNLDQMITRVENNPNGDVSGVTYIMETLWSYALILKE